MVDFSAIQIEEVISFIIALVTVFGGQKAVVAIKSAKTRLSAFRDFVDELDEDVADNHLTEAEYQRIVKKAKKIVDGE